VGDLTLQHVVLRIAAVLLIASVHGFGLAASACGLRDQGPRHDGRLSLNPARHLDLLGGLLAVLFTFGWIRPIALDAVRLRRAGLIFVVGAASCATVSLAVVLRLVRPMLLNWLPDTAAATCFVLIETIGQLALSFTVFNLLPLPPLSGQHLLAAVLPAKRHLLSALSPYSAVLLAVLIASGVLARLLGPIEAAVGRVIALG